MEVVNFNKKKDPCEINKNVIDYCEVIKDRALNEDILDAIIITRDKEGMYDFKIAAHSDEATLIGSLEIAKTMLIAEGM